MSIALESGPGLGPPRFGRGPRCAYVASPAAAMSVAMACSSSSVGRNSDSSAAAAKWEWDGEEVEEGDGEVQSSYKGPFDTMDALDDALPLRRGISKFYNGKSKSFTNLADAVCSSPSAKNLAKPENPPRRKRKGLLAFSFKWDKPQNRELSPGGGVTNSPMSCRRRTLSPAATSSSGSNSSSDGERERSRNLPPRRPHRTPNATAVFASPPAPSPPQLFTVHIRSLSMVNLQDVTESTALVSPRDKRRKN